MDIETIFNDTPHTLLAEDGLPIWPSENSEPGPDGLMVMTAPRNDFERIAAMGERLVAKYDDIRAPEWETSPIGWIRQLSSAHKRGKVGEELVRAWALSEGMRVGGRGDRGHDCVIEGLRLEVKTSLRWNNDRFYFLGLKDLHYQAVALLGLEPNDVRLWILPKDILWNRAYEQKRSADATGSRWFAFPADHPPAWLSPWGGTLAQARSATHNVSRYDQQAEQQIDECEPWLAMTSDIEWSWQPIDTEPATSEELQSTSSLDDSSAHGAR
jgi:hypothetical protein